MTHHGTCAIRARPRALLAVLETCG